MPRRPGRPKKKASERKSAQISVRVSGALKRQLDAAAVANGTLLSQEAGNRLAMSFSTLSKRQEEFGDLTTYAFCRFLALAFTLVREEVGHHWTKNAFAFRHAKVAADTLFELMCPAGDPKKAPDDAPILDMYRSMGREDDLSKMIELLEVKAIGGLAAIHTLRTMEKAISGAAGDEAASLEGLADLLLSRATNFKKEGQNENP